MKVIEKDKFKKDSLQLFVNNEVKITKTFKCENIIKLYENFETKSNYYLILEYCN